MEVRTVTYFTDDIDELAEFYGSVFDAEPVHRDQSIAAFDVDGVTVFVHETYDPDDEGIPPDDYVTYAVEDVDEVFESCVDRRLEAFRAPSDWGRSAYLRDPDGRIVELDER